MTLTPRYIASYNSSHCHFQESNFQRNNYIFDKNDFFLQTSPIRLVGSEYNTQKYTGKIAIKVNGKWVVEENIISFNFTQVHGQGVDYTRMEQATIYCENHDNVELYAYPIDPSMKEIDIVGDSTEYPNPTNTGWLFKHAEREDHHDREVLTEAIIIAMFADYISDETINTLQKIINSTPSNQQKGALVKVDTLVQFRQEVLAACKARERSLYIGQHVHHPYDYHLQKMALDAINYTKQIWQSTKEPDLASISYEVGQIIQRLQVRHGYLTRWDMEKKKKAQSASSSESSDEASE